MRQCPACQIRLRTESPIVPVFHTPFPWQAELVRNCLTAEGIPCLVRGLTESLHLGALGASGLCEVSVTASVLKRHRDVIESVVAAFTAEG